VWRGRGWWPWSIMIATARSTSDRSSRPISPDIVVGGEGRVRSVAVAASPGTADRFPIHPVVDGEDHTFAQAVDAAVVDLESGVCGENAADDGEQIAFAGSQGQAAGRVTCGGNRRADTSPNCAWTKLVMVVTAALVFASGVRNTL
jgi:hypothetical protein